MRLEKRDGSRENIILLAMITSSETLARLAPCWKNNLLKANSSNIIGKLCVDYFDRYGEAPGKNIDGLVRVWSEEDPARERQAEELENQLDGLRPSYLEPKPVNLQHVLDVFDLYVRDLTIRRLLQAAQEQMDSGKLAEAEAALSEFAGREETGVGEESDTFVLGDDSSLRGIYDNSLMETVISYGGGLGEFFGNLLQREGFISFVAPEGSGKSWWLMDMAYRALTQRRRVAFFEVGDMSKRQFLLRWGIRMQKKPAKPGPVRWPVSLDIEDGAQHEVKEYSKAANAEDMLLARDRFIQEHIKSKEPYFHLSVRPAGTVSVAHIEAKLRRLARHHNWIPDCVIIDYADLLAPPQGSYRMEARDQIAESWKQLRALSMKFHCLLVTATQCNREGYDAKGGLRMKHISEEKRKISHVTGLVGINVTDMEKASGVVRLNLLKARDMDFRPNRFVYCAGCLALGRPAVLSKFPRSNRNNEAETKTETKKKKPKNKV